MRYRSILAVAIVAAFLFSVIPVAAEGSDAATITDGSSGAGYYVKDLSGADVDKLIPVAWQEDYAEGILDVILRDDVFNYVLSEVAVSEYCSKEYEGEKIEDGVHTTIVMHDVSYKISFKATRDSAAAAALFEYDGTDKNKDIIETIGPDNNISQEGAVFTVTATVKNVQSIQAKLTYEKNSAGDLVETAVWMKFAEKESTDADVRYDYKYVSLDKSISFSSSNGEETSYVLDDKLDFRDVKIVDVTDTTKYVLDRSLSQFGYHEWDTVTYDDNERGEDIFIINPDDDKVVSKSLLPGYYVYSEAVIRTTDMSVPVYHIYGDDPSSSIFTPFSSIDSSLKDETAIKEFISAHGSYSEGSFDDAQDAANTAYSDVSVMDELKLALIVLAVVIGAFALLFLILIIVVIILIVKRKKR